MAAGELDLVLEQVKLPFDGEPHDYQVEDFVSATSVGSFGFYLDLGLGKTFTSIITACYHLIVGNYNRCIIICPESLITQWVLTLQAMGLDCLEYRGTPKKRSGMVFDKDFSIMSYQIFQKDYERIPKDGVYLIVDEATIMCNSQNILFKMVNGGEVRKKVKVPGRLRPKIEVREFQGLRDYGVALLTATPINNPQDAYGLIKTITPDVYRNYSQFERIHVAKYDYFDQPKEYQELDLLRENLLLQASMRSAGDYIDLPEIVIKTIKYNLAPGHMKVYDQLIDERLIELDGEVVVDALQGSGL
jgi:SNF2 family DNA or RNA helicase